MRIAKTDWESRVKVQVRRTGNWQREQTGKTKSRDRDEKIWQPEEGAICY